MLTKEGPIVKTAAGVDTEDVVIAEALVVVGTTMGIMEETESVVRTKGGGNGGVTVLARKELLFMVFIL